MSPTVHAMGKAAKRFFGIWLIAGALIFCYLAFVTDGFTKRATWLDWYYTHYSSDFSPSAGASSNG